ncbi:efflux transporter outer membrane subunit [Pseudomonas sp. RIT-PI-S]|uniref:efflux transporter outer membrane subunit n=1 Tax=Pseudomonas sp. RIT-PI-S TaxID=3035295 RepID=UPI0021D7EFDF|nr:efflux transporter outer membrane subunit [Pseudomonas sp. RIT-PI-S]
MTLPAPCRFAPSLLLLALLAGCTVGPDYQRPATAAPVAFKEAAGWTAAAPKDAQAKGRWWAAYADPHLDTLMDQVALTNQTVAQYQAQYRQALALARASRADLYPTVSASLESTRSQTASSSTGSYAGTAVSGQGGASNTHVATLSASWELDLWGKLRRTLEENRASAQASAADLAAATLSAQSELAQDYFKLRLLDQQLALYRDTVGAYQRYLTVIENKYAEQVASRADLAQAQTQLESAKATLLDDQWQRAQYEHAIALLIGKAPVDFNLPALPASGPDAWAWKIPAIPVGVPSQLLERRPDIAAAERQVAAANAAIGVATAAYYPDITLSASGGYQASSLASLLNAPTRFWSIGPSLSSTLLDFGATRASVDQASASYDAQVANYRQTVLTGIGEVEDYLVQLRTQAPELTARGNAAAAAAESARVTADQYEAGKIDYLDVATTQATLLSEQQSLLSLVSAQLVASVELMVALGGSW